MSTQIHSSSQTTGFVPRAGYFLWHFLEMCLVMCMGGIMINVLFFGLAARLGFPNLFEKFPQFSLLLVGVNLSIPMIAWMRFRGHEWRPTLEMASTSIILPVVLIGATWLSLIPESSQLPLLKQLACPVMLIPMLFRLDLYAANHAQHHQTHGTSEHHEHAS